MGLCAAGIAVMSAPASASIDPGSPVLISSLSGSSSTFNGGTLEIDASKTFDRDFTVNNVATNTIDIHGSTATLSGKFTGTGPLSLVDTVGNGILTLTGNSDASTDATSNYTGAITINSGATLDLAATKDNSGNVTANASIGGASLVNNGIFDISQQTTGATVVSLGGSGTVNLGTQYLTLSTAADTFSGVIAGTGGLIISSGTETLTGVNTYTGGTTITTGSLILTGNASIATSAGVNANGTFDISQTSGISIKSLTGAGTVQLGSQNLTFTDASGLFSGVVAGTGNVILNNGTQGLYGVNTFTGGIIVNGGTMYVGGATVSNNVIDNATFGFSSTGTIAMTGVISGPGAVTQVSSGITTISTVQTYTGSTTISSGTLALSGSGSIASSSGVEDDATFDIQATTGASITSLSGRGNVLLGSQTLTVTNASGAFSGSISGMGGLTIAGGTETLTGTSTFTGVTTIASGTLVLTSGSSIASSGILNQGTLDISVQSNTLVSILTKIGSLSGSGNVILGSNTLVLSNPADTFSGTISGNGGLTILGGSETFSGVNTYTGVTTISAGTLALSGAGSLAPTGQVEADGVFDVSAASASTVTLASLTGSGLGQVNLGSHTLQITAGSGVFSGVIAGSGGLVVTGGTTVLAGPNTYTGGTTITGGTLQIGNSSISGSIVGNVADAGTLAFSRSDTSVFSGLISGTGGVSQTGSGTIVLTAANSYTGGTKITAGTLQIGNGGTAGSIVGDVTDNGTLAFARSDAIVFGGVISGTGGLSLLSGTTTLTAADTFTGTTAIQSGAALVLGSSGSIAGSSVTDNGGFDVSAAAAPTVASLSGSGNVALGSQSLTLTGAAGTFSGVISGSGGLTLAGGTETLSGVNTYTGATKISSGTLNVTGSIASSSGVTVNSGGTLSGTGTVSAVTVASGGTLAPGAGTLTVNGALSLASGSNFVENVTSGSEGKVSTASAVTLAGTLSVASADGTYPLGQKLTVLTATGGVSGSFAPASILHSNSGAQLTPTLSYDSQNVYLEVDLSKLSPALPTNATGNQKAVIGGIDAAIVAGNKPSQALQNLANLSSATLAGDATQLSGEIGAALPQVGKAQFDTFVTALFDHMSNEVADNRLRDRMDVWLDAYGTAANVAAVEDASGTHRFRSNGTGIVGGANWALSQGILLGAAIAAEQSDFHLVDTIGTGKAQTLQGGVYGYVRYSPHFYGSFAASVALSDIKTDRVLSVSGTDDLKGKLTAYVYGGRYETGLVLWWAAPYVAVQDSLISLPAYTETAASGSGSFALKYASRTVNSGAAEVGFRQSTDVDFTPRWLLTPDGTLHLTDRFAWSHGFGGASAASAAFADLSSSDFSIAHAAPSKDTALASLGADLAFNGGLHVSAQFDTAISANAQSYTGMAGLGYRW